MLNSVAFSRYRTDREGWDDVTATPKIVEKVRMQITFDSEQKAFFRM